MRTILDEIEADIASAKATVAKQNVGTIREIGDGVAKVEGLNDAMLNEAGPIPKGIWADLDKLSQ